MLLVHFLSMHASPAATGVPSRSSARVLSGMPALAGSAGGAHETIQLPENRICLYLGICSTQSPLITMFI